MHDEGYARATTKEIARAAGFSEATLYKHFQDKTKIFLCVLGERLPALGRILAELTRDAGKRTVRENLTRAARTALDFYAASFPIAASLFSSRELLDKHRATVHERAAGPQNPQLGLMHYLRAEQGLRRIRHDADVEAAASLLMGACFQQAFLINFEGERPEDAALDALAASLTETLISSLN